jgi:hypothetical protein
MPGGLLAIVLVLAVALFAWLLRRASGDETVAPPREGAGPEPAAEEVPEGPDEELAITSEGDVFIPDGRAVRIMPLGDPEALEEHRDDIESGLLALSPEERLQIRAARGKIGQALQPGDLTGARIRRGAAGVVPWRLETLGRDGEYGVFPFETEDGARAALLLLERYAVVRRPLDEQGRPIPPSPEDFEEGRRRYEESWRALAMESELGGEEGPGGFVSDRR